MRYRAARFPSILILACNFCAQILPAQITARRLNRYEYTSTVRDLLGVDFHGSFPADNFSYGFDNNAATLTVTPALLAKYLEAARQIARAAVEPVAPPAAPQLERHSNSSALRDITWRRNFIWEGDYDIRVAVAGRADPFALSLSIDSAEPERLSISWDFEARRYAETRVHLSAGMHEIRAILVRDDARAIEEAFSLETIRAKKAGAAPPSKTQIRTRLLAGALPDATGAVFAPYPEFIEVRGPSGLVFPAIPPGYRLVFRCGHAPGEHIPACLRTNIANLAARAWRRPVTAAEIDQLTGLAVAQPGQNLEQQMETAVESILVFPSFLFRIENGASSHSQSITTAQLASRLSYFLWSSMPDDELSRAAAAGRLADPAVLAAEGRRMLADPKSRALAENFAAQWLEFRNLDFIHRDPARFPEFNSDLRDAMREETELFFLHVLDENCSILDFLNAKYTFANELIAKHYDLPGVSGDRFRKVDLTGSPRQGILTQASVLAVTSYATRTSPVLRGKWILENILNEPPPPPPANVAALRDPSDEPSLTLRQQLEEHRRNPACAACHARMDALGFGLENFDAIGRWRTTDQGHPIDAAGALPDGSSFSTPAELASVLSKHPEAFAEAIAEKLMIFALGRDLTAQDRAIARRIAQAAARDNYRLSDLVLGVVASPVFRMTEEAHD